MKPVWFRILPIVSLIISIYVLIAIILINVGGVGGTNSLDFSPAKNRAFNLVRVRFPPSLLFNIILI